MTVAASLQEAAGLSFANLNTLWNNGAGSATLIARTTAFWTATLGIFADADVNGRPVADWATILASFNSLLSAPLSYPQMVSLVDYVYRLCWLAAGVQAGTPPITAGQRTALLAAYNAQYG